MGKKIVSLILVLLGLICLLLSCRQAAVLPVREVFYHGFGPATDFVPEVVTIEWEDSVE